MQLVNVKKNMDLQVDHDKSDGRELVSFEERLDSSCSLSIVHSIVIFCLKTS